MKNDAYDKLIEVQRLLDDFRKRFISLQKEALKESSQLLFSIAAIDNLSTSFVR